MYTFTQLPKLAAPTGRGEDDFAEGLGLHAHTYTHTQMHMCTLEDKEENWELSRIIAMGKTKLSMPN